MYTAHTHTYIHVHTLQKAQFDADLRALWDSINDFTPLSALATQQLVALKAAQSVAVQWEDFLSLNLSHGIFVDTFVGLDDLQQKLARMVRGHLECWQLGNIANH